MGMLERNVFSADRDAVSAAPPRPYRAAAIIAVLTQCLFCYRLTIPSTLMFDEVHYVPAARKLIALTGPSNIEHPLLAKEIIAAGILLFGDNSLGWRFFSTLGGTATVLGVFAILWLMLGRVRPAVFGALFATFNFTVFVQARIGMLDGFMAAFALLGIAALLWAMRAGDGRAAWMRWLLGSVLLGLAVASKWSAAPFVAFAGFAFIAVRLHDARMRGRSVFAALNAGGHRHWPGMAAIPALLLLGTVSVATYFLTFSPAFFYRFEPMTLTGLLPFQAVMYHQQTQILPSHPYQSSWWSWPFMVRPIWYLYERADGAQRGVLLIGNLAILYGGADRGGGMPVWLVARPQRCLARGGGALDRQLCGVGGDPQIDRLFLLLLSAEHLPVRRARSGARPFQARHALGRMGADRGAGVLRDLLSGAVGGTAGGAGRLPFLDVVSELGLIVLPLPFRGGSGVGDASQSASPGTAPPQPLL